MFWAEQNAVLERVAAGHPAKEILADIVGLIERHADGMLCSLLLLDEARGTVSNGASPSLPVEYVRYLEGLVIGPAAGSCGTAAFRKERVIVEDIATHPYWVPYKDLALAFGLRACWSTPIFAPDRRVLGTFAMYYREPRGPAAQELAWVDAAIHLAAIAIGSAEAAESLRRSEARARHLARLYAMSNAINEAMVRERDRARLYEIACRIAVDHGLARLAWVGLVEAPVANSAARRIVPVASAGPAVDYVRVIELDLDDDRMNRGPAAQALRRGAPAVSNDIASDATFFWQDAARAHQLRSCAIFPMVSDNRTTGILAIYAAQPHAFDAEAVRVLATLASDIAFAVESARTEAALRRSEQERALIYDYVVDSVFYLAVEGEGRYRFESVNRAFLDAAGIQEHHVVGKLLDDVVPAGSLAITKAKYAEVMATGKKQAWEQVLEYPTGLRYGEITVGPILDANGRCTHFVGSVHDVTARRAADEERRQVEAQLHQAQRMQALGTLAGGIAHDFNNILASVHCNLDLTLEEMSGDNAEARESLVEVKRAAQRASELVRQILTFSRRSEPRREWLALQPVVEEALALLGTALKGKAQLRTSFAADVPRVDADATQIHQVVMNLVTNAAHAVGDKIGAVNELGAAKRDSGEWPRGTVDAARPAKRGSGEWPRGAGNARGVIDIALDRAILHAPRPDLPDLAPGAYARLSVRDEGCGMTPDVLRRIFEPFFTTKPVGDGTGLGLSVVHGVMKSHGGGIAVRSALGEGTTFELWFPAAEPHVVQPEPAPPEPVELRRQRVLFVDNDEALVFLAQRAFARLGHKIAAYTGSMEALRAFERQPDDFDVVVTDISMPELDGPRLVGALRRISRDVKIVMTSGCVRAEDLEVARALGVDQVLEKPQSLDELARLVEPLLSSA